MKKFFSKYYLISLGFIFGLTGSVYAATTINSNIVTGGTLAVTGSVSASSTLQVTGAGHFYNSLTADNFIDTSGTTGGYYIDSTLALQASSTNTSVAAGFNALNSSFTGSQTVAVGDNALHSLTTGSGNTAVGQFSLYYDTTGSSNTAIGQGALTHNRLGGLNVAVGYGAGLSSNDSGQSFSYNTVLGGYAGAGLMPVSNYNTFVGYYAGYYASTSNSIIIGAATSSPANSTSYTGSQNILIGNNISLPSGTASGQLNIGNIIYGTGITGTGSIISGGNVGIGTSSPATRLQVSSGENATTTISVGELGLGAATSKSCINMNKSDGSPASFYINAANTMVIESNYCK